MAGRKIYVPDVFIREIGIVRSEDEIDSRCEAIRRVVKDARIGRKVRRGGSDVGLPNVELKVTKRNWRGLL